MSENDPIDSRLAAVERTPDQTNRRLGRAGGDLRSVRDEVAGGVERPGADRPPLHEGTNRRFDRRGRRFRRYAALLSLGLSIRSAPSRGAAVVFA